MILTQAQAKAVQDAMCALNNVNSRMSFVSIGDWPTCEVREYLWGAIKVEGLQGREEYPSQADFFKAYNLN